MKRTLSFILLLVSFSLLTFSASAANNEGLTIVELQEKYPDGSKWYDSFDGSSQCAGFARLLCYEAYGSDYWINNSDGKWIKYTDSSYIDNSLKAGDYIRFNGHSVFVTGVFENTVSIADCNNDWKCTVRWTTITKDNLKHNFSHVYSAPYDLNASQANKVKLYQTATVVAKTALTIRQYPDINSKSVGTLKFGTTVNVCHHPITDGSGYTWRLLMDGRGWVCSNYLRITSGRFVVAGKYKIQCANGKYLSYTSTPANDVNIVIYDDLSQTNLANQQIWNFQPLFYYSDWGAIVYRISPVLNSNYSLDCDSTNNELLHLWEALDIGAQQWIVEIRSDGSMRILNNATRLSLDIINGNNTNNTEVITYTSHNGNNQKFYLVTP